MKKTHKILIGVLLIIIAVFGYTKYSEPKKIIEPNHVTQIVLVTDNDMVKMTYPEQEIEWLLSSGWMPQGLLDLYHIYADYDVEEGLVTVADGSTLIQYDMDYETATKNGAPFNMAKPEWINGEVWLPLKDIKESFGILYDGNTNIKTMFVKRKDIPYNLANVETEVDLKYKNDEERILDTLDRGETVVVFPYDETHSYIMTSDYQVGYVESKTIGELKLSQEVIKQQIPEDKIYLTWEIYGRGYDTNKIGEMKGVNTISPAWYALSDEKGNFESKASENYLKWAQGRGYKVWALVSNDFKVDRTSVFLHSAEARTYFIKTLLEEYERMGYDGVNIDFENVYKEDKRQLTQFVAELTSEFRRKGLTVSMDVTVMGGSDTWSKCYDRKALGHMIDYLAIMTYDEHWASSPISGSVASYNWVKTSMERIKDDVPSHKLLLGIPYYMRVWTEVPSEDKANTMRVKSGVLNMPNAEKFISEKNLNLIWDENARQYYAGYFENNMLKKIWFENADSIREKASLINELELGGAAVWRRGFETQDIWSVIDVEMNGE